MRREGGEGERIGDLWMNGSLCFVELSVGCVFRRMRLINLINFQPNFALELRYFTLIMHFEHVSLII